MAQLRGRLIAFISCFILNACFVQSSSSSVQFIRELSYNISSTALSSSVLAITNVQTEDRCLLHCFETQGCISVLYRKDSTECLALSGFLNDLPLDGPTNMADVYYIGASLICSQMGYTYEGNIPFCYKIHRDSVKRQEAYTTCSAEGGRLMKIDTPRKQAAAETFEFNTNGRKCWIDGEIVNGVGTFASGSIIQDFYWYTGQPSRSSRGCLTLHPDHGNRWHTADCSCCYRCFICEKLL